VHYKKYSDNLKRKDFMLYHCAVPRHILHATLALGTCRLSIEMLNTRGRNFKRSHDK